MKTEQELEALVKQAAYKVTRAFSVFKGEPAQVQQQAKRAVMARVGRMLGDGENLIIEGHGLVTVIPEPGPTGPINTQTDQGEDNSSI